MASANPKSSASGPPRSGTGGPGRWLLWLGILLALIWAVGKPNSADRAIVRSWESQGIVVHPLPWPGGNQARAELLASIFVRGGKSWYDVDRRGRIVRLRISAPELERLDQLKGLDQLARLEVLDLSQSGLASWDGIGQLSGLRQLRLDDTRITSLPDLRSLMGLEVFTASGCPIDSAASSDLGQLKRLDLSGTRLEAIDVSSSKELSVLGLADSNIASVVGLEGLDKLKRLDLSNTPWQDFHSLTPLSTLDELRLEGTAFDDTTLLPEATSLRKLDLRNTAVDRLIGIEKYEELWKLDLRGTTIDDLAPVASLHRLWELGLPERADLDLSPLGNLPQLMQVRTTGQLADVHGSALPDFKAMEQGTDAVILKWRSWVSYKVAIALALVWLLITVALRSRLVRGGRIPRGVQCGLRNLRLFVICLPVVSGMGVNRFFGSLWFVPLRWILLSLLIAWAVWPLVTIVLGRWKPRVVWPLSSPAALLLPARVLAGGLLASVPVGLFVRAQPEGSFMAWVPTFCVTGLTAALFLLVVLLDLVREPARQSRFQIQWSTRFVVDVRGLHGPETLHELFFPMTRWNTPYKGQDAMRVAVERPAELDRHVRDPEHRRQIEMIQVDLSSSRWQRASLAEVQRVRDSLESYVRHSPGPVRLLHGSDDTESTPSYVTDLLIPLADDVAACAAEEWEGEATLPADIGGQQRNMIRLNRRILASPSRVDSVEHLLQTASTPVAGLLRGTFGRPSCADRLDTLLRAVETAIQLYALILVVQFKAHPPADSSDARSIAKALDDKLDNPSMMDWKNLIHTFANHHDSALAETLGAHMKQRADPVLHETARACIEAAGTAGTPSTTRVAPKRPTQERNLDLLISSRNLLVHHGPTTQYVDAEVYLPLFTLALDYLSGLPWDATTVSLGGRVFTGPLPTGEPGHGEDEVTARFCGPSGSEVGVGLGGYIAPSADNRRLHLYQGKGRFVDPLTGGQISSENILMVA